MLERTNKEAGKVCGDSQDLKSPGMFCYEPLIQGTVNPIRTGGGGGVFHQARGFLPITLEVI